MGHIFQYPLESSEGSKNKENVFQYPLDSSEGSIEKEKEQLRKSEKKDSKVQNLSGPFKYKILETDDLFKEVTKNKASVIFHLGKGGYFQLLFIFYAFASKLILDTKIIFPLYGASPRINLRGYDSLAIETHLSCFMFFLSKVL